jgi:tetratricopeptide (TPR) repeat protein
MVGALLAALVSCGEVGEGEPAASAARSAELLPVPEPVLDAMAAETRASLEEARGELDELLGRPEFDDAELADAYRRLGNRYHVNKMREAAKACYRNAESLAPGHFATLYLLAVVLQEDGEEDEAFETFERALAVQGDYAPALLRTGEVWLRRNEPERARPFFEQVAEQQDYRAAARYGLGRIEAAAKAYEAAVEHFEAALELQPGATKIHYPLGLAYRSLGRRDEAELHLEAYGRVEVGFPDPVLGALRQAASGAAAHVQAANHALVRGDNELAEREYRKALAIEPDHAESRRALGLALWRMGRLDEAIEQYRAAFELEPTEPENAHSLAILLVETGLHDEAVRYLEATLELDPESVRARLDLAEALLGAGRPEDALRTHRQVLGLDPHSRAAQFGEAAVLAELGRVEEAIDKLRTIIAADPTDGEALVNLASTLIRAGRPDQAVAALHTARELGPEPGVLALVNHNLGVIHARRGEWDPAIEAFGQALSLDPTLTDTRFMLAGLLARSGRMNEAAGLYRRNLEDDPRHLDSRVALATALVLQEQYGEARKALEDGLVVHPGQPDLALALAKLLATCPDPVVRNGRRALELALESHERTQGLADAETVAMAYAEVGSFDEAVRWQRELIGRAQDRVPPEVLEQFRRNLRRYENGEPCRAPWQAGS